jgi:ABC-type branched-subunit amino acid transport system substrate-binding protein
MLPIAEERAVPFVAPFTGASSLRDPGLRQVINLRASYRQETERGVARLVDETGLRRIAVLFQDDTFGRDGLEGVRMALSQRDLEPVADATYMRNTTAVKRAALDLRNADPQAVFIIGAYEPAAAFIRVCRELDFQPTFMTLSFVGSVALATELGAQGRGVFITQVMPSLQAAQHPAVTRYLASLTAFAPGVAPSYVSLEGYLAGRLAIETLQGIGPQPTRADFIDWLRSGELSELDGLPLAFGPDSNQGSAAVFLTVIGRDGELAEVGR